jgi:hypothetical protein
MKKKKALSRKIGDSITPFELKKIEKAPGLKVIDSTSPNRVIVEGDPQSFEAFLRAEDGWVADPAVNSDTRPCFPSN